MWLLPRIPRIQNGGYDAIPNNCAERSKLSSAHLFGNDSTFLRTIVRSNRSISTNDCAVYDVQAKNAAMPACYLLAGLPHNCAVPFRGHVPRLKHFALLAALYFYVSLREFMHDTVGRACWEVETSNSRFCTTFWKLPFGRVASL